MPNNDDEHNMAISIGGFTYGVSPVELAAGYATLEIMEPTEILHVYQELPIQRRNIVNNPGEGYSVYTKMPRLW